MGTHKKMMSVVGIVLCSMFLFMTSGCSGKQAADDVVVRINNYTLTQVEFDELFRESGADDTLEGRQLFLDGLIMRVLILQAAEQQGLDKEKEFLKAIEIFWEQSLNRIMIEKKTAEFGEALNVSDAEMKAVYEEWKKENPEETQDFEAMKSFFRWQVLREKQDERFNNWIASLRGKAAITINKEVLGMK